MTPNLHENPNCVSLRYETLGKVDLICMNTLRISCKLAVISLRFYTSVKS